MLVMSANACQATLHVPFALQPSATARLDHRVDATETQPLTIYSE